MPQIIAKYVFSKLLVSRVLREHMQRLHLLSGMDVLLIDDLGVIRLSVPRLPSMAFVQLMRAHPETAIPFRQARQSRLTGVDTNVLGFREISYAIPAENEIAGYLILSGYRENEEQGDLQATREGWRRLARGGLPVRWADWYRVWSALPSYSREQRAAWLATVVLSMRDVLARLEKDVQNAEKVWPPMVQQACRRIQEAFDTPLRMQAVAAELGVCPEHLSRIFHQATGMRFGEYLAETRIGAACDALTQTSDPIADIAHRCGFSTLSRFNRCFRQHRNATPRSWRKRAQLQKQ